MIAPMLGLVCVILFFTGADSIWGSGKFATTENLRTVLVQISVVAVAALGMTVIIIAAGIDLSAGTALALAATTLAWGLREDVFELATTGTNFRYASAEVVEAQENGDNEQLQRAIESLTALVKKKQALVESELPPLEVALTSRLQQWRPKEETLNQLLASHGVSLKELEANPEDHQAVFAQAEPLLQFHDWYVKPAIARVEQKKKQIELLKEKEVRIQSNDFSLRQNDSQWMRGVPNHHWSAPLAILVGACTGLLAGLANGLLVSWLKIAPFIVTLGAMTIYLGLGHLLSGSVPIRPALEQVPYWLTRLVGNRPEELFFGLSPGVWMLFLLAIALTMVLRLTVFGRYVFAIGSNEQTARLCGVNVHFYKVLIYAVGGLFVGIAGVYQFARLSTGNPESGMGLELKIIAAVVIGGGSLNGGRGAILGTLAGAAIMAVIDNGCTQIELPNPVQRIILGLIIIGAVGIDRLQQRFTEKSG